MSNNQKGLRVDKYFFPWMPLKKNNDSFFSGRKELLQRAFEDLGAEGSALFIYGERQVGKTTFANQMINLLLNQSNLSFKSELNITVFDREPACVWFDSCSFCQNLKGLVASLILSPSKHGLKAQFPEVFQDIEVIDLIKETEGISINLFKLLEFKSGNETTKSSPLTKIDAPDIVFEYFRRIIDIIQDKGKKELIIFIDEFDKLDDKKGFGDLLKLIPEVRFVILGIADNITQLIGDHPSVRSKVVSGKIKLPNFNRDDIAYLFRLVEERIFSDFGLLIKFTDEFLAFVETDGGGIPGYAHLIGLRTLQIVKQQLSKNELLNIDERYYDKAVKKIFNLDLYNFEYEVDEMNMANLKEILKTEKNKKEIIFKLSENSSIGMSEDDLYNSIEEDYQPSFELNISSLCEGDAPILKKGLKRQIKFADPLLRMAIIVVKKYNLSL